MYNYFEVKQKENKAFIIKKGKAPIINVTIFTNQYMIGSFSFVDYLVIDLPDQNNTHLYIQGVIQHNKVYYSFSEDHLVDFTKDREKDSDEVDYQAGDILVACDNLNGLPVGYMGHSGIVVNSESVIDSVMSSPIIRKIPVKDFINNHPNHAHFRPKSEQKGKRAAKYAIDYLEEFKKNKKQEINEPIFNFTITTPLTDEWTYIYCSKLVWLSYYYGADYEFYHDGLWFAPEDLYSELRKNDDFKLIYIHPDYKFNINI